MSKKVLPFEEDNELASEAGMKGGKASQEVQKQKRSLNWYMKRIAAERVRVEEQDRLLESLGFAEHERTQDALVSAAIMRESQKGNVSAVQLYRDITNDEMLDGDSNGNRIQLPAYLIASSFVDVNRDIDLYRYKDYIFKGGRGSTKSSYISLKIIELIMNNRDYNALIVRKVKDTLRDSVLTQMEWAIGKLRVEHLFKITKNPMEIVYLPTGQKIYFRGSDESAKIKGLKTRTGYVAVLWFEEVDQFNSMDEIRMIKQSALRGGDTGLTFLSFNPPRSSNNWINKYIISAVNYSGTCIHHSDYRSVPRDWLGDAFFIEAELQKEINENTYNHEYLGNVIGTGDQVFDNIKVRPITDKEIASYNNIYHGLDFGFKDPTAFNSMSYDHERRILYIYDEWHEVGLTNVEPIDKALRDRKIPYNTRIIGDSANPDKIAGLNNIGWGGVIGAIKGHGSLKYGYDFLVGLNEIVIDNSRCPNTTKEFTTYTLPRNRQGELINVYPEGVGVDDHHMATIRYALEEVWRNKYNY